jgi:hypothetical protein
MSAEHAAAVPLGVLQPVQQREPEQSQCQLTSAQMGRITSAGEARVIQFALKLLF